ncbi:zinc finger protein 714 isoform X15 [Amyelois transitella]|uniref:zinc finger protein 714 isoform X15 n=1 Tax=Amyelois transitella TaxID=680683 RepID=UPI00298FEEEA|nr:zinc finger protein 714 isoform X15 [Amyelois transitella]
MAAKSEWRPGPTVCRCCLTEGCYKDISTEYFWMGKREVYAEMLKDTLEVTIAYSKAGGPNSNSRLICESCISRLRDATEFKRQVVECERMFMQHLDPGSSSAAIEAETEPVGKIKVEGVKLEKSNSDDDFDNRHAFGDDDDDDDDDLDNQPLTKLASKMPTKESVDLLDLLDNSKTAEKRKSSTKVKPPPPKKAKSKVEQVKVKPSGSKLTPKPEKKKKDGRVNTTSSIWTMTALERENAAILIESTTIRPFTQLCFPLRFQCFYCHDPYPDIDVLLQHSNTHKIPTRKELMKNYLKKGKKTIKVDISDLKCRLCNVPCSNLNEVRNHLIVEHGKKFTSSGNGMIAYNLKKKDGVFTCHLCSEKFNSFFLLNKHINVHYNNAICESCGKGFVSHRRLIHHKKIHNNGQHPCDKCNMIFPNAAKFKYHADRVHGEQKKSKPSKCQYCSERFEYHYEKMKHLSASHGISFEFKCELCNSIFKSRKSLSDHTIKYHTQNIACEICQKPFSQRNHLNKHMATHTEERNYSCPLCAKTYRYEKNVRVHMKVHNVDWKYACSDCFVGFSNKIQLRRHLADTHKK